MEAFTKTLEQNVNGDGICIQTIDSWRINHVWNDAAATIEPAPKVIGYKPPQISEQVRAGQSRNSMPNHPAEVDILYAHAVDV